MSALASINIPKLGQSFFNDYNAAAGVVAAFLPAANVRGCILQSCTFVCNTSGYALVVSDTAAPAAVTDETRRAIARGYSGATVVNGVYTLPNPIYLNPGWGLWFATTGSWELSATWDFVP